MKKAGCNNDWASKPDFESKLMFYKFPNFSSLLLLCKNALQGEIFSDCSPHKNTCYVMLAATVIFLPI